MRKLIHVDMTQPQSLGVRLGAGVQAYAYGSVVKGTATADSDLDVYVSGPRAANVEERYAFRRPLVKWKEKAYPLHVVGPNTVDAKTFFESQPEARRVL